MRVPIKILGVIYCALGGLIALFLLLAIVMQAFESLGITKSSGKGAPGWGGIVSIILLLGWIVLALIQIGIGLWRFNLMTRTFAIYFLALPLMIGLNTILLLTKDRPGKAGVGWIVFHLFMIALGVLSLIILLPKWGREQFR